MTVETTNSTISYTGNGSVTTFAYNFLTYSEDHLFIYLDDVEQTSGFSITGIGDESGGSVIFDVAPDDEVILKIDRTVPETQLIEYQEYGPFPAKTNERGLDLGVMIAQQNAREIGRDSSKKMDKQPLATEDNIVTFDDEGNSKDSGVNLNNSGVITDLNKVIPFDTLDEAVNETNHLKIFIGAAINIKERTTGNGGGAMWDVVLTSSVVPDGKRFIQSNAIPTLTLKLRVDNGKINIASLGAKESDPDSLEYFIYASNLAQEIIVSDANYTISSFDGVNCILSGNGKINDVPVANTGQGLSTTIYGFDAGKNFSGDYESSNNTLIGRGCGRELTTGERNTAIGQGVYSGNTLTTAPPAPTTGSNNFGGGFHALKKMESGTFNIGIGTDAGNEIKSGGSNTLIGGSAGQQITIAFDNTCIGRSSALRLGLDASSLDPDTYVDVGGGSNTTIGRDSMRNAYNCSFNTVIGAQAVRGTKDESDFTGNFTGEYNVIAGYRAMYTNPVNASFNVVLGEEALRDAEDNSNNVIIGTQAARDSTQGDSAIIIGSLCLRGVDDISNNFAIANQSGLPYLAGIMGASQDVGNYLRVDGNFSAQVGSTRTCGTAGRPWTTVFADNNVIQPSDARLKTTPEDIDDKVFVAWGNARKNIKMWKWLNRGEKGRYHIGPIAQELFKCFEDQGVNPFDYGFACSDLVFETENIYDGDALVSSKDVPVIDKETGQQMIRYSVRHNELFMLEIAYNVWRESKI